ncbi:hypothetical protein PO909_032668 [Leuciscus waleckii]
MADKLQKRKGSGEYIFKKKGYDQARGSTSVNIEEAFQRWRELKQRVGLVTLDLLCFTELRYAVFCLNILVCNLCLSVHLHYYYSSLQP